MHLIASRSNPDYLALLTKLPNENLIVEPGAARKIAIDLPSPVAIFIVVIPNSLMVHVAANVIRASRPDSANEHR